MSYDIREAQEEAGDVGTKIYTKAYDQGKTDAKVHNFSQPCFFVGGPKDGQLIHIKRAEGTSPPESLAFPQDFDTAFSREHFVSTTHRYELMHTGQRIQSKFLVYVLLP